MVFFYWISNHKKILGLILLFGLCLRIFWILFFPNQLYADSVWYYEQAVNLSQGKGYLYKGAPSAIWPIGYPLFLSLLFKVLPPSQLLAKFVNVGLLTLDLYLVFQCARLSTSTYFVPYLAAIFIALMPTYIFASSLIATEPLFTCLLHLGVIILLLALKQQRDWLWILAGGLSGLMTYVRAEAVVFLLIILFFYCLSRPILWSKFFRREQIISLLIIVAAIVAILPWTIRNFIELDMFVPISTTGCMNMWMGHVPTSDGGFYWSSDPVANPVLLRENDTEQTWYRRSCAAAIQAITVAPLHTLSLWPKKIVKVWENDRAMLQWHLSSTAGQVSFKQAEFLYTMADSYYYSILFLGILGAIWQILRIKVLKTYRETKKLTIENQCSLVGIVTVVGFTLIYLPFFGAARFHFALIPLLAVYAGEFSVFGFTQFRSLLT